VYVYKPLHEQGDFFQFSSSALITSPRATEALRDHLEMAGELLPLPHEGQEYTALNVTLCINSLDRERTEWAIHKASGKQLWPRRYAFHAGRFPESSLFKIPETRASEILLVEGGGEFPPDQEFRSIVIREGLRGLAFDELWSDES
jgi:hypothetical protein